MTSLDPHKNYVEKPGRVLLSPFYRWESWVSKSAHLWDWFCQAYELCRKLVYIVMPKVTATKPSTPLCAPVSQLSQREYRQDTSRGCSEGWNSYKVQIFQRFTTEQFHTLNTRRKVRARKVLNLWFKHTERPNAHMIYQKPNYTIFPNLFSKFTALEVKWWNWNMIIEPERTWFKIHIQQSELLSNPRRKKKELKACLFTLLQKFII